MGHDVSSPRGPRCIALVGPFQSGKTTLLEAILARTGAIPRAGSVDAGTSYGDASAEARHHKMGTGLSAATTYRFKVTANHYKLRSATFKVDPSAAVADTDPTHPASLFGPVTAH